MVFVSTVHGLRSHGEGRAPAQGSPYVFIDQDAVVIECCLFEG
jgi:hypothetical protein